MKRLMLTLLSLAVGAAVWLPCLHLFFRPHLTEYRAQEGVPEKARALAARHLALWEDEALKDRELGPMRAVNEEWDFMGRTFLVLALANMALRDPDCEAEYIDVADRIIDDTLRLEKEKGHAHFLMPYAGERPFTVQPPRSLFVDGEIALMMAARRLAKEREDYKPLMRDRIETMIAQMEKSPILAGESYPDECWIFCNTVAAAAVKLGDILDGTRREDFLKKWLDATKKNLLDPGTGLLYAAYTVCGAPLQGPEGSSIWMAAHCLQVVDEDFASDQYRRAKRELGRAVLGFGYAREWPPSYRGSLDVDSGAVVPLLGASPASSGLALMGASAFGDRIYFERLIAALKFAAFPREREGKLRFCASNQVGDSVLLYSMVLGPLWERAKRMEGQRP